MKMSLRILARDVSTIKTLVQPTMMTCNAHTVSQGRKRIVSRTCSDSARMVSDKEKTTFIVLVRVDLFIIDLVTEQMGTVEIVSREETRGTHADCGNAIIVGNVTFDACE